MKSSIRRTPGIATRTATSSIWTSLPPRRSESGRSVRVCTATHPGVVTPTGVIIGNAQRFQVFALGGLVEYNFGAASFSVWATQEIMAKASNSAARALFAGED